MVMAAAGRGRPLLRRPGQWGRRGVVAGEELGFLGLGGFQVAVLDVAESPDAFGD